MWGGGWGGLPGNGLGDVIQKSVRCISLSISETRYCLKFMILANCKYSWVVCDSQLTAYHQTAFACLLQKTRKQSSKANISRFTYTLLSCHRYLRSIRREAHNTRLLGPQFSVTAIQMLERLHSCILPAPLRIVLFALLAPVC